jgi:hypothetical protein
VERAEAEAILDGDRETAVALLMRVDELVEANRRLEAWVNRRMDFPPQQSPAPRPEDDTKYSLISRGVPTMKVPANPRFRHYKM